ncbi:hypothetical protein V6N13_105686 [Hibiscus sabdariffa]
MMRKTGVFWILSNKFPVWGGGTLLVVERVWATGDSSFVFFESFIGSVGAKRSAIEVVLKQVPPAFVITLHPVSGKNPDCFRLAITEHPNLQQEDHQQHQHTRVSWPHAADIHHKRCPPGHLSQCFSYNTSTGTAVLRTGEVTRERKEMLILVIKRGREKWRWRRAHAINSGPRDGEMAMYNLQTEMQSWFVF